MKLSKFLNIISQIAEEKSISKVYICGGLPRDKVLNKTNDLTDIDITTGDQGIHYLAKEIAIKFRLDKSRHLVMPDGHASLMIGGLKLDCSSNFMIPNIEQLLAKRGIEKADEMQKELYSRDFTCNALLMSMDLKQIFDPLGRGIPDIKQRIIKTCLSPEITLGYDNKRVVRILYLAAKLDFDIDPAIISWVKKNPTSFSNTKPQYLVKKLTKALEYNTDRVVKLLDEMNLWPYVPPVQALQPYMIRNTKRL